MKYIIYPLTMVLAYCSFFFLKQNDLSEKAVSYITASMVALWVTVLEIKFSFRSDWVPKKHEVISDLVFMFVVQILLPVFLSFSAIQLISFLGLKLDVWPHQWPLVFQTLLMLVGAEFFRYWMHRLAHLWIPLWRLHAVHHAPDKVYWLNTARFHPLEKVLQFFWDALPFIILGVSPNVVGLYFVFYSVNGFFQHSNVDIRFGILNYFISGPELHRWHHSVRMKEANNNFGNNLIIWDLIFGTWYLPKEGTVKKLGIFESGYNAGFFKLMLKPFKARVYK